MTISEAEMRVRAARLRLIGLRPYFSQAIFAHVLVEEMECPSLAVDGYKRLYFNPRYVMRHSVESITTLLMHELGHSLRDHHGRAEGLGVTAFTAPTANIAMDAEINDDIRDELRKTKDMAPLPGSPYFPGSFGAPDYQPWEFYYSMLRDRSELVVKFAHGGDDEPDKKPSEQGTNDKSKSGKTTLQVHDCGSGAHGSPRSWEAPFSGNLEADGVEGVTFVDWKEICDQTAKAIQERERVKGDVPGSWIEWSNELLRPRIIPWDELLSADLRQSISDRAGYVFYTYQRPSRRQIPNFILPAMRRPRPVICIIGDTSGSMDTRDLALVRGVTEDVCCSLGATVTFLATDTQVQGGAQRIQGGGDAERIEMRGRGGTNMVAGIEYALEKLRPAPDTIVVVTDCATPWPANPPRARVIVCGVGNSTKADVPEWARFVAVDPDNTSDRYTQKD